MYYLAEFNPEMLNVAMWFSWDTKEVVTVCWTVRADPLCRWSFE